MSETINKSIESSDIPKNNPKDPESIKKEEIKNDATNFEKSLTAATNLQNKIFSSIESFDGYKQSMGTKIEMPNLLANGKIINNVLFFVPTAEEANTIDSKGIESLGLYNKYDYIIQLKPISAYEPEEGEIVQYVCISYKKLEGNTPMTEDAYSNPDNKNALAEDALKNLRALSDSNIK